MEFNFFLGGTGNLVIEGIGSAFTWTNGSTGAIGRIVLDFSDFFGASANETMTYQIVGSQLNLTHTMFGDQMTTILVKAN